MIKPSKSRFLPPKKTGQCLTGILIAKGTGKIDIVLNFSIKNEFL
jgi:hypothetical protein